MATSKGLNGLERRVAELEDDACERPPDIVETMGDDDWEALSILMHELEHPRGAEITPEVAAEVEKRLAARRRS